MAKVYQVDVFLHVTIDGGARFAPAESARDKHADNHVVWIDPADPDHLLVGCDAGLYVVFGDELRLVARPDRRYSQFYRVAVDDGVRSRRDRGAPADPDVALPGTGHVDGVRNEDWWDATRDRRLRRRLRPHEPDISYLEWQVGLAMRHDRRTRRR